MLPTRSLTCQRGLGQVVLRWLTNATSSLSPSRRRLKRMVENLDVFDFTLTSDEMTRIAAMDTGATLFFDHRDPAMVSQLNSRKGI